MDLKGKVAIVTGASRGIGAATAVALAEAGAAVACAARSTDATPKPTPGTIDETVRRIEQAGGRAVAVPTDLSDDESTVAMVTSTVEHFGRLDILVNNAAVTFFIPVDGFPEKRYRLMFEVQVRAPFELAQAVLPGMRARRRGWVLNISSVAAVHPVGPPYGGMAAFGGTVYGMCKAALERFSTGLAAEVHADGIAVNALSPTLGVATPGVMFHRLPEGSEGFAEPVEVMVEAALALCSGDPATLTGRIAYSQALLDELGREPGPIEGSR